MLLTNATFEFIDHLSAKEDVPSVVSTFEDLLAKFGMRYYMVGNADRPTVHRDDRLWMTNWPQEWLDYWSEQRYLYVDPVSRHLREKNEPVRWSQARANAAGSRVLMEANAYGMRDGFALPIYSRDGFVVAFSVGAEHYELGKTEETCLHVASIFLHAKLERLRAKATATPLRNPKLTPRERECLTWVAAGKTDWETSQILNIAEQTVHEYVQNAMIKLNATTRAQAVALAIATKLISA